MSVLVEDSPRNLDKWIISAVTTGPANGVTVTPFASPWLHRVASGRKHGLEERAEKFRKNGVPFWFDPMTHALQMGGVGDFRFYDEYSLWGGTRGDLGTPANRSDHVRRVFEVQDVIGSTHLAPTVLLHAGLSAESELALRVAQEAVQNDPDCWLSIAGTSPFWASEASLDAHIGGMAQLQPAGWFLTVVRTATTLPVEVAIEEVHGLCRAARALSEYAPVHVAHGDLAGLPAIAAGASSVGTGWDQRQRMCSYTDYAPRLPSTGGGSWYERPTLQALLGSLTVNEAQVLMDRDPSLAGRLGGLPAPGAEEAFQHQVRVLSTVIGDIDGTPDHHARYIRLLDLYNSAAHEWLGVQHITACKYGADAWVDGLRSGLLLYGATEGW
jgi:hypothetical protein